MNLSKPARIALSCGLFFLLYLVNSSFDFSFVTAASVYLLLTGGNFIFLFISSGVLLLTHIVFQNFEINLPFVSDLSIDAYILFLTGVVSYLQPKKYLSKLINKISIQENKFFTPRFFLHLSVSIFFALLIFPITGEYLAAILGYLLFSSLVRQFNGKIAVGIALIILVFAAIAVLVKKSDTAEDMGVFAYFFLVVGTLQEIIKLINGGKPLFNLDLIKEKEKKVENHEAKTDSLISMRISHMRFPKLKLPEFNPKIIIGIFTFFISFVLIYILIRGIKLPQISFLTKPIAPTAMPTVIPTLTVTPTVEPTAGPKPAVESGKLKILLQNGTEIRGLAASASAKLEKSGFTNVSIGNATRQDYSNWEVNLKNKDTELIENLKNILELEELDLKEASMPAEIDILIIAGKNK